ncbi:hypothetical protein QBC34DRAFT_460103 [Podospora aff. communis PSN243]|uniref:Uncharacterized protein n=1 Tax=Podospora aff. communis PSN243 TaxID=3040156 RepID=A0AAV9H4Q8_9PEZI|nr:hypothetical protein QBC34DRAFT_460103 [Podospora aff. communis PSN243]
MSSSDWATHQRAHIIQTNLHNTGHPTPPTPDQEFAIAALSTLTSSPSPDIPALTRTITAHLTSSAQPEDAWNTFHTLLLSLAQSTSSPTTHQNLASLLVSLAQSQTAAPEVTQLLNTLHGLGWSVRDLWNGPKAIGGPDPQRAWINLNRFMAYLSVQNRKTPVAALDDGWVEDFGMWTICDGLESEDGFGDYVEAAAGWLEVAGREIWKDAKWGGRDGSGNGGREGGLWVRKRGEGGVRGEERWGFWRGRLEGMVAEGEKGEEEEGVKAAAGRAVEVMVACERG